MRYQEGFEKTNFFNIGTVGKEPITDAENKYVNYNLGAWKDNKSFKENNMYIIYFSKRTIVKHLDIKPLWSNIGNRRLKKKRK